MKKLEIKVGIVLIFLVIFGGLSWMFAHRPAVTIQQTEVDLDEILSKDISDLPEIPDTKEMCEAVGGVWGKIGIGPVDQCNIKTSDAGNGCIDSKACESLCIADLSDEQLEQLWRDNKPIETRGKCAEWRIVVGCQPVVEEGRAVMLCID